LSKGFAIEIPVVKQEKITVDPERVAANRIPFSAKTVKSSLAKDADILKGLVAWSPQKAALYVPSRIS
jgi:hypothetical protein